MEPSDLYFNHPPDDLVYAKLGEPLVLPDTMCNTGKGSGHHVGTDGEVYY